LKQPTEKDCKEIRRLILEKLVLGRYWGMKYLALEDIPKGLPRRIYQEGWYYKEVKKLVKDGFLLRYKKKFYRLNIEMKQRIEELIGERVQARY
jgi:hypothetical protein